MIMDCAFCTEFAGLALDDPDSRVIAEEFGWVLLPTVGCFTPGYCLFMPIEHLDAVADATHRQLWNAGTAVERMRALITSVFGPTIIAEHGPRGCELGAGCCSHAHLHLIPVPDVDAVSTAYQATGGPGRRLDDLTDLTDPVDDPYLYLSPRPGEHRRWSSGGFARQYVRRVCAALHGIGGQYDWRDYPFEANQNATITALRSALRARVA